MVTVALIVHEMREDAAQHATELGHWLAGRNARLVIPKNNADEVGALDNVEVRDDESLADGADVVVSLGGDGSMLRAVELAAPWDVPVLGVNFGQLGYLTEVEPSGMLDAVASVLDGTAEIELRLRVGVSVRRSDGTEIEVGSALNEALVERDESGRTVRLGLSIDDEYFINYNADGVIIASPTGSTAYSLSARGPIVAPLHEALIVTPVSPHQLFDRSLILAPDSIAQIEVLPDRSASLSLDGRTAMRLEPGDRVRCTRSARPARIISLHSGDFLTVLKTKFGLNGD